MATQTQLFEPPAQSLAVDENRRLAAPLREWLFSVQNLLPLVVVDTSAGSFADTVPAAGLNSTTGQSNQNMEITFVKSSADANTFTLHGVQGGDIVIAAQYARFKVKSDGTNWWQSSP
jgi:hypothetical protein